MSIKDNTALTPGESSFAWIVGGTLLAVSMSQGATYLWKLGTNPLEHLWLVGMVIGVLLASQCLARMAFLNWQAGHVWIAALCIILVCGAETFSYKTTKAAFSGRAGNAIREQNLNSPEYKRALKQIENYQTQVDSLNRAYNDLPATFATKRENIQSQLNAANSRLEGAQKNANGVNVSVIGKSLGDGGSSISTLVALLQSAMPLGINLATIMLSTARRRRAATVKSGKKPQGRKAKHLQSVA